MKKPTRPPPPPPPPPPPLPPKCRSYYSLSVQAGSCAGGSSSEYGAESFCSMPATTIIQKLPCQCISPATSATYFSCRSETANSVGPRHSSCINCSRCCPTPSPCSCIETCSADNRSCCSYNIPHSYQTIHQQFTPQPLHRTQCSSSRTPSCIQSHSPCASSQSLSSHHNLSNNSSAHNHGYIYTPQQQPKPQQLQPPIQPNLVPPSPRARVTRPRLSISPIPELKNRFDPNSYKETRSHDRCKSSYYRRHVEQHVEKVFKYLQNRKQRREECFRGISSTGQNAKTIQEMLKTKESLYLRSLRTRISQEDFQEIQKLGSGFIGNVWLVKKIPRDESTDGPVDLFAMKKLKKSQVFQQNHLAHVMAERDILAEADNEWIVKLYYSFQDSDFLYFILEYIPGGDMMNLLVMQSVFPEDWACFYIAEISLALQFVHDMGFIHRDIKPDNILIDAKGHIKLTDFGLCTGFRWTHDSRYYRDDTLQNTMVQQNDIGPSNNGNNDFKDHPTITKALTKREIEHSTRHRALSLVGSPNYIAPEVLRQAICQPEGANERLCDWWSVGVILYEMVIGYCPFINLNMLKLNKYDPNNDPPADIQARILYWQDHLAFPSPNDPEGPPQMPDASGHKHYIRESTKSLIKGLLCDPQDRLCQNGIRDIMDHPFFHQGYPFVDGISWDNLRSCRAPYVPKLKDEFDTTHFEQFPQMPELDNIPNGNVGSTARMPINDFTYKCYWWTPKMGEPKKSQIDN